MTLVISSQGNVTDSHSDDPDGSNHCFVGRKLWLAWDTFEGRAAGLQDCSRDLVRERARFDLATFAALPSACWWTVGAGETLFLPGRLTHRVITLEPYIGIGSFYCTPGQRAREPEPLVRARRALVARRQRRRQRRPRRRSRRPDGRPVDAPCRAIATLAAPLGSGLRACCAAWLGAARTAERKACGCEAAAVRQSVDGARGSCRSFLTPPHAAQRISRSSLVPRSIRCAAAAGALRRWRQPLRRA